MKIRRIVAVFYLSLSLLTLPIGAAVTLLTEANEGIQSGQMPDTYLTFHYAMDSYELQPVEIDGQAFYKPILTEEPSLLQAGAPDLPVIARSIIIPDTGDADVYVVSSTYRDYPDTPIAPSKGPLPRTINPADVPYSFGPEYQTRYWPAEQARISAPYILRNYRGATVYIQPFAYFPETQTLRVYTDITVGIIVNESDGDNRLTATQAAVPLSKDFESIYKNHFINYDSQPARDYTALGEHGNMLVISADALSSSVEPLVTWKRQKGIPTTLVDLSDVGSTANNIKSFVQGYYNTNGLTFLLLVGDSGDVPSLSASGGASDPSYSKLAGSDNYPDIFVGRLCSGSGSDIATMVTRIIRYESQPDASGTWYHKATGLASDEGSDPSDIEHMNAIRSTLLGSTYTSVDQIYDPGATVSEVANAVNAGRGLINYVGHGDVQEWVTSGFANANVNSLTNTTRWPVIFDVACVNGEFNTGTCFAEAWIRASHNGNPAGAAAIYASTINQDWEPPMTAQNEFNDLLVAGSKQTFGGLCYNASMKMMDDWSTSGVNMFNTWTIFGDPSLLVYSDTPTTMSVTHDPGISSLNFPVQVSGVSGALAAISQNGVLLGSAYTDGSGNATISLNSVPAEDTLLTVTAFNHIPYTSTLSSASAPTLEVSPGSISNTVAADTNVIVSLVITNSGDTDSVLTYAITAEPDLGRFLSSPQPDRADTRDLTGSTANISPSVYTSGASVALSVTITNNCPDEEWDAEWIIELTLDFPPEVTVLSGTKLAENRWGLPYKGASGAGATAVWRDDTMGDDAIENAAAGTLNVTFSAGASGDILVPWTMSGDEYGDSPHTVTGLLVLTASGPPPESISLSEPNGGDVWPLGTTQAVTWTTANCTQDIDVLYSADNGSSWTTIANDISDSGSFDWVVASAQTTQALVRVQTANASVDDTSESCFTVYQPVDWITVTPEEKSLTGNVAQVVSVTMDATGKAAGTYYANLVITSSGGNTNIPVTMIVSVPTGGVFTFMTSCGANGQISPVGPIEVDQASSTNFVVTADSTYFISSMTCNGSDVFGAAGMTTFTSVFNNVQQTGMIDVAFTLIDSVQGTNDTPVLWLRDYYEETDLETLLAQAGLDTDGDGLLGWQEAIAQTDPTDADSAFKVEWPTAADPAAESILTWWAVTGRTYTVYVCTNMLSGFELLQSGLAPGANGMLIYTDSTHRAEQEIFYGIKVER